MILGYDHPHFGQFPAVVTTDHGRGRITTVGTLPNPALAADLDPVAGPERQRGWGQLPPSVTVHSATNGAGERIHVVHNWSWTADESHAADADDRPAHRRELRLEEVDLGAWDVRVLIA